MQSGTASFDNPREGMSSPLAKRLFAIDGVTGVFFGSDFVTVTKSDVYPWSVLKPEIFAAMMEHFSSGQYELPASLQLDHDLQDFRPAQLCNRTVHRVHQEIDSKLHC